MLSGDNGILQKTTTAKAETENANEKEQIQIAVLGSYDKNGSLTIGTVNTNIKNNISGVTTDEATSFPLTVIYTTTGHSYKVDEIGKISSTTSSITINEFSISGTPVEEANIPVPAGFTHTEGTKDTGFVIQDGDGNEFVWVPVMADQKIELKVESSEDITSITLKDPYNQTIDLGISGSIGTSYKNKNIIPNLNGGYTAEVTIANGTENLMLPVRSLYAQDAFNDYSDAKGKATSIYVDTVDYTESVNTNGGFYIARYEAGTNGTNRTSGNSSLTAQQIITTNGMPVSKADKKPYNFITQSQAKDLAESIYPSATHSFTCTLPTGAAWDKTISWIINTENGIDLSKATYNSSDWGNYNNVGFTVSTTTLGATGGNNYSVVADSTKPTSGMLLTTGANITRNVSNNIFDLAGNVCEWTTEARGTFLVYRGGGYYHSGSDSPSSSRDFYSATYTDVCIGFRSALYL